MVRTIAVFDDDATILDAMRDILTDAGYRFVGETTADNALAVVLHERPAVVILDFWMADQAAGLAALRLIREHPATTLREYAEDWRALGCETLAKPFDLDDLLDRVAGLIA